jgi:hypothetical protein
MSKTRCFINKYGIFWTLCLRGIRISIYLFACYKSTKILLLTLKFHYYEQSSIN